MGSFNPIDVGKWSHQVYVKQTEVFFAAKNLSVVKYILALGTLDVNHCDHVCQTSLHVALISHASDITCELIPTGDQVSVCLVDGKTPLHLGDADKMFLLLHVLLTPIPTPFPEVKKSL